MSDQEARELFRGLCAPSQPNPPIDKLDKLNSHLKTIIDQNERIIYLLDEIDDTVRLLS